MVVPSAAPGVMGAGNILKSTKSAHPELPFRPHDTLVSMFVGRVAQDGSRTALRIKQDGKFIPISWNELAHDVRKTAAVLVQTGVCPGDRVVQVAENRYEWIVCDLAIQLAQAVHVPVHAPLTGPQITWQVDDSQARVVLVSGSHQCEKLAECADRLPEDVHFLSFDPCSRPVGRHRVRLLAEESARVDDATGEDIQRKASSAIIPDSLATILYTSGTTGEPKGVMLTQRNLVSNTVATCEAFHWAPDDLRLSFLPLSHVFARTCDLYTWIALGLELALAESRDTVLADCAAVGPTLINGVPYFYDRVYRHLREQGVADHADSLRKLLGGRIRLCCSGGAALSDHVCEFFHQRGLPLVQGYGLTESSPVITLSTPDSWKMGTVGRPIAGVEVHIADDGEILTRGPHVMAGYWRNQQATDEVIIDCWLHTGDIGQLDEEGYLSITGRKKELIVTAGGKNIAPVYLESLLTESPLIQQAVVCGDGRKFVSALIVPEPEQLKMQMHQRGIDCIATSDAMTHPEVHQVFRECIDQQLSGVSRYEQIGQFTLLERGFTVESGELTPKLSLRRKAIETNFSTEIEAMYQG